MTEAHKVMNWLAALTLIAVVFFLFTPTSSHVLLTVIAIAIIFFTWVGNNSRRW